MKKVLYILCLALCACGGSSEDAPPSEEQNEEPTVPLLIYPTNSLLCIENTLNFQWDASTDSDNDAITYTIQISTDNQFNTVEYTNTLSATSTTFTLERGVAYYWRVKATDSQNASSNYAPTYNFFTEGDGITNHLPFAPELITPSLNSTTNPGIVSLQWSASDSDDDPLTFDIYVGTQNPPTTIFSADQFETNLDITTVSGTDYFWKVVVKDDAGGQTIGQIWNFSTN